MFFNSDASHKLFAAIGSLVLSAAVMAATIIPASPAGILA
jgi:hypothetical protein